MMEQSFVFERAKIEHRHGYGSGGEREYRMIDKLFLEVALGL
jgi:hypothetical protein